MTVVQQIIQKAIGLFEAEPEVVLELRATSAVLEK
jgi:hypothetical protein